MPSTTRSVTTGLDTQPSFSQYLGKRVSFEGCIVNKLFSSDSFNAMTVEVEEEAWKSTVGPAMQAAPQTIWQAAPTERARFMKRAVASNNRKVKVCGKELALLKNGQRCVFTGSWAHHTRYGLQLNVESVKILALDREEDILARLEGLTGVGRSTAKAIYQAYGKDTVSVLNSATAEEKLQRVPRIGKKLSASLKKEWDEQSGHQAIHLRLKELGLKPSTCSEIIDKLSARMLAESKESSKSAKGISQISTGVEGMEELLVRDPYKFLIGVRGVTFRDAEELAASLGGGVDPTLPSRGGFVILQVLTEGANDGHSFMMWEKVRQEATKLLQASPISKLSPWSEASSPLSKSALFLRDEERVVLEVERKSLAPGVLDAALKGRFLPSGPPRIEISSILDSLEWPDQTRCYITPLYKAEKSLSKCVAERVSKALAMHPPVTTATAAVSSQQVGRDSRFTNESEKGSSGNRAAGRGSMGGNNRSSSLSSSLPDLNAEQLKAVQMGRNSPIMLLTGDAGCGKTSTTRAMVEEWVKQEKRVAVCAPTGRAAQRLQEVIDAKGVEAKTVHRLLGFKGIISSKQQQDTAADTSSTTTAAAMSQAGATSVSAASSGTTDLSSSSTFNGSTSDSLSYDELYNDSWKNVKYNEYNLLPFDAVLVDEASMMDIQMAAALIKALHPDCQLVLVGDPNQLPPVAPGHVLAELLALRLSHEDGVPPAGGTPASTSVHSAAGAIRATSGRQQYAAAAGYATSLSASAPKSSSVSTGSNNYSLISTVHLVPRVHLGEVFRQDGSGSIVSGALQIMKAQYPTAMRQMSFPEFEKRLSQAGVTSNSRHAARPHGTGGGGDGDNVLQHLQDTLGGDAVLVEVTDFKVTPEDLERMVIKTVEILKDIGVNVQDDVQVLTPLRAPRRGYGLGASTLNPLLQPVMNCIHPAPPDLQNSRFMFSVADRVVQNVNNYDLDVYNGDVGVVRYVNEREKTVEVQFPTRPGSITRNLVTYQGKDVWQLQPSWATTVHKSQGGEYPCVLLPLHHNAGWTLQTRQLLYTGVTRARQLLILMATRNAIDQCLRTDQTASRSTSSCIAQRVSEILKLSLNGQSVHVATGSTAASPTLRPGTSHYGTINGPHYGTNNGPHYGTINGPHYGTINGPHYRGAPSYGRSS
ncbi:hypothetical protein CEUSTIGMA_g6165.t1 [Chlamydomonas eustigma]|uniref:Helix-hairpin-helix DNA-binding motif class 1 domain-containing protein n=1 Tax=Chlamydomonas eustigma TaxID=1157962 RepID=A0A250X6M0_9CHLO|nr:hypothetical protein CEUSTIGMA_g6165.t1 [Chlamydomonas eustigma]|eukprot:GAX78728.1 hypothetical protein CEUSTIGMA_g6165.t1 [Chlamydomonas eustigma]